MISSSDIRELDLGSTAGTPVELSDDALGAVVLGSIVSFGPNLDPVQQRDVLESLLLAQLAANAKADRYKQPSPWFAAYKGVLEQIGWVVEGSTTVARYLPQTSKYTVETVVNDLFRPRVTPADLSRVNSTLTALRSDQGSNARDLLECPSHSGGLGNFQTVLALSDDVDQLEICLSQVTFNVPAHVTRMLSVEFSNVAQVQFSFTTLRQNAQIYSRVRGAVSEKVKDRFSSAVGLLTSTSESG